MNGGVKFGVLAPLVSLCVLGCANGHAQRGLEAPDGGARLDQDPTARAVVAVAEGIFTAMRTRDARALRDHFVDEARIYRIGAGPTGPDDLAQVTVPMFIEAITAGRRRVDERFTQTPSVQYRGSLAQLWGSYELRVDGELHHCGVNSMQLVRRGERWLVTAITYSDDPAGCD